MDELRWDTISSDYYSEVLSPLKDCKHNPLFDDLKILKGKENELSIIELGCGVGELVPFLEDNFKSVTAIDFSQEMITSAIDRNKARNDESSTTFLVKDMANLSEFEGKFDVAVAVNSMLTTDIMKLHLMIKEVFKILKPGGKLFVIIPSMEVYIYQNMLFVDQKLNKGQMQDKVLEQASKTLVYSSYDAFQGLIDFGHEDKQKAFYRFEIVYRFGKAGFSNFNIEMVPYRWTKWKQAGQKYFPKEEPPWDWYFTCDKPV